VTTPVSVCIQRSYNKYTKNNKFSQGNYSIFIVVKSREKTTIKQSFVKYLILNFSYKVNSSLQN